MGPQAPKLAGGKVSIDSEDKNPQTGSTHCQAPPDTSPRPPQGRGIPEGFVCVPWTCWCASSAEMVLHSPEGQPGKQQCCCPWCERAAAGLAGAKDSLPPSSSSMPQPPCWGYQELEGGQVHHALWLQIKVPINVWDMYKILNLAEGTPTVEE